MRDSHLLTTEALATAVGQTTGNLAFHYAIDLHLGGGLQNIDWGADPAQINAQAGCAVVPCANQLGVHADLGSLADRFHHIDRPIVAIGLGAQSHSCLLYTSRCV